MKKMMVFGLSLAAFIGILLTILERIINISHWYSIDFNLSSYHPSIPFIGLLGVMIYLYIAYKTKAHKFFWIIGFVALAYDIFMLFGVINTYFI